MVEFKYLMSTFENNSPCGWKVKKRVQSMRSGWRKMSRLICSRKISARVKGKALKTIGRYAMALMKGQEASKLKMPRFGMGVIRWVWNMYMGDMIYFIQFEVKVK